MHTCPGKFLDKITTIIIVTKLWVKNDINGILDNNSLLICRRKI